MINIFIGLSVLSVIFALFMVFSKKPVNSLLHLIACFFTMAGLMVLLKAEFLAVVNVIVYAGAIVVLFLFTVMLMNLNETIKVEKSLLMRLGAIIASGTWMMMLLTAARKVHWDDPKMVQDGLGSAKSLGKMLLNDYAFAFEMVSILLITAMIGTVLLTKKDKTNIL